MVLYRLFSISCCFSLHLFLVATKWQGSTLAISPRLASRTVFSQKSKDSAICPCQRKARLLIFTLKQQRLPAITKSVQNPCHFTEKYSKTWTRRGLDEQIRAPNGLNPA